MVDRRFSLGALAVVLGLSFSDAPIVKAAVGRWTTTGPSSSNVSRIVVDPQSAKTVYALANGFLFKSTNGGESWRSINPTRGTDDDYVYSFEIDPFDPDTVLAGRAFGLVRSIDGGSTWSGLLPLTPGFASNVIIAMAAAPSREGTFFFSTPDALYRTDDGGDHFTMLVGPWSADASPVAIAVNPTRADTVYVSVATVGLFWSRDGGLHWSAFGLGLIDAPSQIFATSENPTTLYALSGFGSIFKTTEIARLWVPTGPAGQALSAIAGAPDDPAKLYAGGEGIFVSLDRGSTWSKRSVDPEPLNHVARIGSIAPASSEPGTLFAGTVDDGLFRSYDDGSSWSRANAGLVGNPTTVIDATAPDVVYAGGGFRLAMRKGRERWRSGGPFGISSLASESSGSIVDAGTGWCEGSLRVPSTCDGALYQSTNGGDSWDTILDGAIYAVAVDPINPQILYASVGTASSSGYVTGTVQTTSDGGAHWTDVGIPESFVATRLLVDPNRAGVVFATDRFEVFRSFDGGRSWAASPDFRPFAVWDLALDPHQEAVLYAATPNGVYRSGDSGQTWSPTALVDEMQSVAVDPAGVVYAGGYGAVFRSSDFGANWFPMSLGLGKSWVTVVRVNPGGTVLYSGNFDGVYEFDLRQTRALPPRSAAPASRD